MDESAVLGARINALHAHGEHMFDSPLPARDTSIQRYSEPGRCLFMIESHRRRWSGPVSRLTASLSPAGSGRVGSGWVGLGRVIEGKLGQGSYG